MALRLCLILCFLVSRIESGGISITTSGMFEFATLSSYDHWLNESTSLQFLVKPCSDAGIHLLKNIKLTLYNISITAAGDVNFFYENNLIGTSHLSDSFNCQTFSSFNLTWTGEDITLQYEINGTFQTILRSDQKGSILEINEIGFSGGSEWLIATTDNIFTVKPGLDGADYILQDYGFQLDADAKGLVFEVKTCGNAILRLRNVALRLTYQINITNQYISHISIWRLSTELLVNPSDSSTTISGTGPALSCDEYKLFRINWIDQKITVERQYDSCMIEFLTLFNVTDFRKYFITIRPIAGVDAIWRFHYSDQIIDCVAKNATNTTTTSATTTSATTTITTTTSATTTSATTTITPTTNTTVQPEETTPGITDGSTWMLHTDKQCTKVCSCQQTNITYNSTEIKEMIAEMQKELTVTKTTTTNYIRSKTSAPDDRPSAAGIGYIGAVLLAAIVLGVIALDLPNLLQAFTVLRHNVSTFLKG